nr:hypothetical protein [Tanacetum cinerariifolium]
MCFFVLSDGSINPQNKNKDAFVDGKEHDNIQNSVSPDIHSLCSGDQTRKQGDKTENKDKGKSHVVTIKGFRDLNAKFEECINNSSNGVNTTSSSVSAAGQNCTNSTNDFSAAGPSNAAMPNLEDLLHDADDVGAKADINNMESIILVSPIPTTRIHKDHPTSQIIGDLSSTTQTRSMARAVRDQEKSDAAEGFKQIIDFLSGSYIHYALTVNPHIYISCIKQFSNSVSVKRSGDVTSQWKFLIHTILQSLSTKRTSWNEFSAAMASAVICLLK